MNQIIYQLQILQASQKESSSQTQCFWTMYNNLLVCSISNVFFTLHIFWQQQQQKNVIRITMTFNSFCAL